MSAHFENSPCEHGWYNWAQACPHRCWENPPSETEQQARGVFAHTVANAVHRLLNPLASKWHDLEMTVDAAQFEQLKAKAVTVRQGDVFHIAEPSPEETVWWLYRVDDACIDHFDGPNRTFTRYRCGMPAMSDEWAPSKGPWAFDYDTVSGPWNSLCPGCGRVRISLCFNGNHRCEKCDFSPELGRVLTDDEIESS